jgi:SAM-dependent methyltransferase
MQRAAYIHGTAGAEQARLSGLNQLTNRAFVTFLELHPTSRVVEVGSGLGILARDVGALVPDGLVVGVEYSAAQLAAAERALPNVRFLQGDAHRLPLHDDRFDVAYCRYVLEHVADPLQVLREMRRVLKPGGKAFVQENDIRVVRFDPDCPTFDAVWNQFAILQQQLGGDAFVGKKLFGLFKRAGFREIALSLQPEIHHGGQPTFRPRMENTIGNIRGGAAELEARHLASRDEINRAITELRALAERDDATALFYWNRAAGVK